MHEKIRVFIVDDHEIFRNGLKTVLNRSDRITVVGEAGNGREFLELCRERKPDVVLMDIEMPGMNGIEATRTVLGQPDPKPKVIALTMFNDDDYVQSMLDAGASGFLIKNVSKDTLEKAIETISKGGTYYSEELFDFFTKRFGREGKVQGARVDLTPREKEILQLMAEGLSNKEIADVLYISERTVVGHKSNLLSKTGCKSALALLTYAIKYDYVIIK
jgi:DNA-binding NarL/FixJ family response regulator